MILSISTERVEDITTVMTHRWAYCQSVSSHWYQAGWTVPLREMAPSEEHYIFIGWAFVEILWGQSFYSLGGCDL